jgi:hypothetical protein
LWGYVAFLIIGPTPHRNEHTIGQVDKRITIRQSRKALMPKVLKDWLKLEEVKYERKATDNQESYTEATQSFGRAFGFLSL